MIQSVLDPKFDQETELGQPEVRYEGVSWIYRGKFWIFGGRKGGGGIDFALLLILSNSIAVFFNDLWSFQRQEGMFKLEYPDQLPTDTIVYPTATEPGYGVEISQNFLLN
jgi:hypothetical protein